MPEVLDISKEQFESLPAFERLNISKEDFESLPEAGSSNFSKETFESLPERQEFLPIEDLQSRIDNGTFNPLQYSAELNTSGRFDLLTPEQQNKLIEAYRYQAIRGITPQAIARGIEQAPEMAGGLVKGAVGLAKRGVILSPVGRLIAGPEKTKKALAETGAALESGALDAIQFGRGAVRKIGEMAGVGAIPPAEMTPEQIRERFFSDLGLATQSAKVIRGQGAVTEAVSLDAESLKKEGIELDTQAIEDMSILADPTNFVPVAGGFAILNKLGKTIGFVKGARKIEQAVDKVNRAVAHATGKVTAAPGATMEAVGRGMKARAKQIVIPGVAGAIGGGIVSGDPETALKAGLGALVAPFVFKHGGELLEQVGKQTRKAGPLANRVAEFTLTHGVEPAAAGAIIGGTMAVPLALLAENDDAAASLIAGGIAFGGVGRVAQRGAQDAGQVLGSYLAEQYQNLGARKVVESPGYGNPLDEVHKAAIEELATQRPADANVINQIREAFRTITLPDGRKIETEIYFLPPDVIPPDVPGGRKPAAGVFTGLRPEGRARIYLWENALAVFHEPGHLIHGLIKQIDPEAATALTTQVNASFPAPAREVFREYYDTLLWGDAENRPKSSEAQVTDEIVAESFSNLLRGHPLDGLPTPFRNRIASLLGGFLELSGLYTPPIQPQAISTLGPLEVAPGGVSPLGVGHSFRLSELGTGFLNRLGVRIPDEGAKLESVIESELVQPREQVLPKPEILPPSKREPLPITPPSESTGADEARKIAAEAPETSTTAGTASPREILGNVAEAIAQQAGLKVNYLSAPDEPAGAITSNRDARRAVIEFFRTLPPEARALWEKNFFPDRIVKLKSGKYQILGWAPEVFAANAHKLAAKLQELGVANASPYPVKEGTFTPEGWQELFKDVQTFVKNQMGGRTGAGESLVVPRDLTERGFYAPPIRGKAEALPQLKADFINMLFGIKLPKTAGMQKGKFPLNLAGQAVSEATQPGRTEIPVIPRGRFEGAEAERQGIAGQDIKEVNPLRQQIEAAAQAKGVAMPEFIEAQQRLNLENIKDVQVAPELPQFRANTLTLSAGFQPKDVSVSRQPETKEGNQIRGTVVAKKGRETVGRLDYGLSKEDGFADIYGIEVEEAFRRQGLGQALMESLKERAHTEGIRKIQGSITSPEAYELRKKIFGEPIRDEVIEAWFDPESTFQARDVTSQFQPSSEPRAIRLAAVKDERGKVWEGMWHGEAEQTGRMAGAEGPFIDGFTTNNGEFLNRPDAFIRAKEVGQIAEATKPGLSSEQGPGLETSQVRFQPPKNAEQAEELVKSITKMSPKEFDQWAHETPGGLTEAAYQTGLNAATQGFVNLLKAAGDSFGKKAVDLAATDVEAAMVVATQQQFFNEAWQAATGEGSAGFSLRKKNPNFQPKFPLDGSTTTSDTVAQMQPKKDIGNTSPEEWIKSGKPILKPDKSWKGYWVDREGNSIEGNHYWVGSDILKREAKDSESPEHYEDTVEVYNKMYARGFIRVEAFKKPDGTVEVEWMTTAPSATPSQQKWIKQIKDDWENVNIKRLRSDYRELGNSPTQFQPKKELKLKPAGSDGVSKVWVLPDGKVVNIGGQWHHEYLNDNPALRKQYKLSDDTSQDNRLGALQKGFARLNWSFGSGHLTIEARTKDWPKQRDAIRNFVEANAASIDRMQVVLMSDNLKKVDDANEVSVFTMEDREKAAALPFGDLGDKRATGQASERLFERAVSKAQRQPGEKLNETDVTREVSKHIRCDKSGSCMFFAEDATQALLDSGFKDFKVVEGYVRHPQKKHKLQHTWIELSGGEKIDPTFEQFESGTEYAGVKKKYAPEDYLIPNKKDVEFLKKRPEYKKEFYTQMQPEKADESVRGSTPNASKLRSVKTLEEAEQVVPTETIRKLNLDLFSERETPEQFQERLNDTWANLTTSQRPETRTAMEEGIRTAREQEQQTGADRFVEEISRDRAEQRIHREPVWAGKSSFLDKYFRDATVIRYETDPQYQVGQHTLPGSYAVKDTDTGNIVFKQWLGLRSNGLSSRSAAYREAKTLNGPDDATFYDKDLATENPIVSYLSEDTGRIFKVLKVHDMRPLVDQNPNSPYKNHWPEAVLSETVSKLQNNDRTKAELEFPTEQDAGVAKAWADTVGIPVTKKGNTIQVKLSDPVDVNRLPVQSEREEVFGRAQFQPQKESALGAELEKIRKGESSGQTFTSIGEVWTPGDKPVDIVTVASVNVPTKDLTAEKYAEATAPYKELLDDPNVVAGVFSLNPETTSIDINAVVPQEHRENTKAFAKANDQMSIWDAVKFETVETGGTGETKLKSIPQIKAALSSLTQGEPVSVEDIAAQLQPRAAEKDLFGFEEKLSIREIAKLPPERLREIYPEALVPEDINETIPSAIIESPLYEKAGSEDAAVKAFSDGLVKFAQTVRQDPVAKAGAEWYTKFTPELKKEFGKDAQLMAELLAATSPNTGVETNFKFALDALDSFKSGRFTKIMTKFNQGMDMVANDTWKSWYNKELKNIPEPPKKPTAATFLEHWIYKHDLKPRQSNGKLYGIHSLPVLQVFARKWFSVARGPKTLNFIENLMGQSHEATIDVWADRTMRRLGYAGEDRWRILPKNVRPVSDPDFEFAQKAFRHAANRLGMKPSALQGMLWFAEKKYWAEHGWADLNLGDFRTEFKKIPALRAKRLTLIEKSGKIPSKQLELK